MFPRQRMDGNAGAHCRTTRSAHRTPVSFARSGTALSGSVAYRRTRLRRVAPLPALPPSTDRTSAGCQTCFQTLRLRWCSSFNGWGEPLADRIEGVRRGLTALRRTRRSP